jgi:hypothetical protein
MWQIWNWARELRRDHPRAMWQSWVGQCDKFGTAWITEKFSLPIDWLFNWYAPCCSCIVADNQAVLVSGRSMFSAS